MTKNPDQNESTNTGYHMLRIALVIATIALIVWALPRTTRQQYHYDVGKPWMYG